MLENGTTVQTPVADDVKDENLVRLDPGQTSKYRSHVARCLFLRQDRADITFAVNELCQRMSDPSQRSFSKLNRLVRYLQCERRWIPSPTQTGLETKKRGNRQALESRSWNQICRKQTIIATTSAEAELYAAALGASEAKGCPEQDV